jgi:type 1 fimbria pilin
MEPIRAILVSAFLGLALGASAMADNRTVRGEVVDLACSISKGDGGKGEAHGACAMTCARKGDQMAILANDAVYLVEGDYAANQNAKLLDFVARKVEAKGNVTERDGKKIINIAAMLVQKAEK